MVSDDAIKKAMDATRKDKYLLFAKPNRDGSRKKFVRNVMQLKKGKASLEVMDDVAEKYGNAFVKLFAEYICIDESEDVKKATMQIAQDFIDGKIVMPKQNG